MTSAAAIEPFLDLLRCPISGEALTLRDGALVTASGARSYAIDDRGVPLFARDAGTQEARVQEAHYDRVARSYLENLGYPHTVEYTKYWDRVLLDQLRAPLDTVAEICCGAGEAIWLVRDRIGRAIGVDISTAMLAQARGRFPAERFGFVQGDATSLPLRDGAFDAVLMFGGIHHVNQRAALFAEIARILKPAGRFHFREPLNDFLPWRISRALVYRLSPALDEGTEHPLRREETIAQLRAAGLDVTDWKSIGFVASCILMNSDVLVFNRAFRVVPGIRGVARGLARLDEACLRLPGLRHAGVAVSGVAVKT